MDEVYPVLHDRGLVTPISPEKMVTPISTKVTKTKQPKKVSNDAANAARTGGKDKRQAMLRTLVDKVEELAKKSNMAFDRRKVPPRKVDFIKLLKNKVTLHVEDSEAISKALDKVKDSTLENDLTEIGVIFKRSRSKKGPYPLDKIFINKPL
jgi:hypothetical protein